MKYVFIINPVAGKSKPAQQLVEEIDELKKETGLPIESYLTQRPQHATELVRKIAQTGEDVRFYACGGDGTLNEVLCGAYGYQNVEVGHIPCGSGNDMIRNFGNAEDFRNLKAMLFGKSEKIDLIEANGRKVASICAAGLDGKVAYLAIKIRRCPLFAGGISYDLAALKCLFEKLWYRMQLTVDGEKLEDDFILTAFGNGRYYGGGYKCLPGSRLDDGLLNIVLVKKMPFFKLPDALKKYKAGDHFGDDGKIVPKFEKYMVSRTAKEISVHCDNKFYYTIDGEIGFVNDLKVQIIPDAIRFITPEAGLVG